MTTIIIVSVPVGLAFVELPIQSQAAMKAKHMSFTANRVPGTKTFSGKKLIQILAGIDTTESEVTAVVPAATVLYLATLNNSEWVISVPLHASCNSYREEAGFGVTHHWLGLPII